MELKHQNTTDIQIQHGSAATSRNVGSIKYMCQKSNNCDENTQLKQRSLVNRNVSSSAEANAVHPTSYICQKKKKKKKTFTGMELNQIHRVIMRA